MNQIQLISSNNEIISCQKQLLQFSEILSELNPNEKIQMCFSTQIINQIVQFYHMYNFDEQELNDSIFTSKITSSFLKDNLNKKSLDYLKEIGCIINESKINTDLITELIDATYVYQFDKLKQVLLKAIATDLFCNDTEEDIENFKKKHKIDDISPEEQFKIMHVDFKNVFDEFNEKSLQQLKKQEPNLFN